MRPFFSRMMAGGSRHRGELLSVAAHLSLILCLFGGFHLSSRVAPMRLPGTALGVTPLSYFSPGSVHPITSESQLKSRQKTTPAPMAHLTAKVAKPDQTQPAPSQTGTAAAAQSGLGEGDITIALQTVFLYPNPDLSSLPRGTKGDVILDAVIDEQGKISELTLLKGLGSPVDETVIAAVRQWQYTPAKKNGVPVVSEQELHFHYERG
jgi:periplasmic protein TonB